MYKSTDNKEFKTVTKLMEHELNNGLEKDDVIANLYFDGKRPECKCGCGKKSKYNRATKQFNGYLHGHGFYVNTNPSIGTKGTKKAKDKMKNALETKQKMIDEGTFVNWNTGQTAETNDSIKKVADSQRDVPRSKEDCEKISIGFKKYIKRLKDSGEYHSKFNNHMREYWANPVHRAEQSERVSNLVLSRPDRYTSKKEILFSEFLTEIGVNFRRQFRLCNKIYNKVYDFKIEEENVLIEYDGNWWHCNPKLYPTGPKNNMQIQHKTNDKIKDDLALEFNYKLIRIWEYDFDNNKELIKEIFKPYIKNKPLIISGL